MKYRPTPLLIFCAFLVGVEIVFFAFPEPLRKEHYGNQHIFLMPVIVLGFLVDVVMQEPLNFYVALAEPSVAYWHIASFKRHILINTIHLRKLHGLLKVKLEFYTSPGRLEAKIIGYLVSFKWLYLHLFRHMLHDKQCFK